MSLQLKPGLRLRQEGDVHVSVDPGALTESDRKELRFWQRSPEEGPESDLFDSIRIKAGGIRIFESLIPRLALSPGMRVLEVGAGQGWPGLMLKRAIPDLEVHASELAAAALASAGKWEGLIGRTLDGKWACSARDLPFADDQFDLVFTYEAFHHLGVDGDFATALAEMVRVLRPGGRIVLLREPTAPAYLHGWRRSRFNRIRKIGMGADVDEDVLVPARLVRDAKGLGLVLKIEHETSWAFQENPVHVIAAKSAIRWLPILGRLLPSVVTVTGHKMESRP